VSILLITAVSAHDNLPRRLAWFANSSGSIGAQEVTERALRRAVLWHREQLSRSPRAFWREYLDTWSLRDYLVDHLARRGFATKWARTKAMSAVFLDGSALRKCAASFRRTRSKPLHDDIHLRWFEEMLICADEAVRVFGGNGLLLYIDLLGPSLYTAEETKKTAKGLSKEAKR
jgi:hypothetical protein